MRVLLLLSLLGYWSASAFAAPRTSLLTCDLGGGKKAALLGESHGIEGQSLFVAIDGNVSKAFPDFPDAEFVGNVVLAKCIDHALVFALNYGPPYLKGMAIRFNSSTSNVESVNSAEKALPTWIFTGSRGMLVVFPNKGNESGKRFIVYQFIAGQGQKDEPETADALPSLIGYKAIHVRR